MFYLHFYGYDEHHGHEKVKRKGVSWAYYSKSLECRMVETEWQQVTDMLAGDRSLVLGAHILNHNLEVERAY